MKIESYVERLNFSGSLVPSDKLLTKLHFQHVQTIPFENINNFVAQPVVLETDALFDKIIFQKRGGYCYELSGLFYALLLHLGFDAKLLRAKLFDTNELLEESVHAVIEVNVQGQSWLLDVGYGIQGQLFPLAVIDAPQIQHLTTYHLQLSNNDILLSKSKDDLLSKIMLINRSEVNLDYFNQRNHFHQTNNESMFKKDLLCSLYSAQFGKSLKNKVYTYFENDTKFSQVIGSINELSRLLNNEFSIVLNEGMLTALNHRLFIDK